MTETFLKHIQTSVLPAELLLQAQEKLFFPEPVAPNFSVLNSQYRGGPGGVPKEIFAEKVFLAPFRRFFDNIVFLKQVEFFHETSIIPTR